MKNTTKQQVHALFLRYGEACRILTRLESEDPAVYDDKDRDQYNKDLKDAHVDVESLEQTIKTVCSELPYPDEEGVGPAALPEPR